MENLKRILEDFYKELQEWGKAATVDKKVFKVNLGDGIKILTCEELRYRFDNLTQKEQDYLNKNARKCTNITDINLDISNVTSYKDVFNAP